MFKTLLFALLFAAAPLTGSAAPKKGAPTVLITGANRGIGLELARQYAARGWNVIATSRHPLGDADYSALNGIVAGYPQVVTEQLDVTDTAMIRSVAGKYRDQPIDVLINNAAAVSPSFTQDVATSHQSFESIDFDGARRDFDVNTLGAMRVSQAFLSHVERSQQKKIIMMTSFIGSFGRAPAGAVGFNYGASKAALNKYAVLLSLALQPRGVIVALVQPEFVASKDIPNMSRAGGAPVDQEIGKLIRMIDSMTMRSAGKITNFSTGKIDPF